MLFLFFFQWLLTGVSDLKKKRNIPVNDQTINHFTENKDVKIFFSSHTGYWDILFIHLTKFNTSHSRCTSKKFRVAKQTMTSTFEWSIQPPSWSVNMTYSKTQLYSWSTRSSLNRCLCISITIRILQTEKSETMASWKNKVYKRQKKKPHRTKKILPHPAAGKPLTMLLLITKL